MILVVVSSFPSVEGSWGIDCGLEGVAAGVRGLQRGGTVKVVLRGWWESEEEREREPVWRGVGTMGDATTTLFPDDLRLNCVFGGLLGTLNTGLELVVGATLATSSSGSAATFCSLFPHADPLL